jgi:very-short-patch-repair endonuclease
MPTLPSVLTLTGSDSRIYNKQGQQLERFVRVGNQLLSVDALELDDLLNWGWTPLGDNAYEVSHQGQCRLVESEAKGHVWVRTNDKLVCAYACMGAEHIGPCHGARTCCRECGDLWLMYSQHQGRCWPCILRGRTRELTSTCSYKTGVCKNARTCITCFPRCLASYERSLYCLASNSRTPYQVAMGSNKWVDIHCPGCDHDVKISPVTLKTRGASGCKYCAHKARCDSLTCDFCFQQSFASHPRSKHWHPTLNGSITPRQVAKSDNDSYWFMCPGCPHPIKVSLNHITDYDTACCVYCSNRERCSDLNCTFCLAHSFESHPRSTEWHPTRNGTATPRQVALNCNTKYWFLCGACRHESERSPNSVVSGNWCPYCRNLARCDNESCQCCFNHSFASHCRAANWHPTRNGAVNPRQVAKADHDFYWFLCPDCGNELRISLDKVSIGRWCRYCKMKTARKLLEWLRTVLPGASIQPESTFNWCRNPKTNRNFRFDFYIASLNLIIELDGRQHWEQVSNWTGPEANQVTDLFKMMRAFEQGITVLRICQEDVMEDRYDWRSVLSSHLKVQDQPTRHLLDNGTGIYERIKYTLNHATTSSIELDVVNDEDAEDPAGTESE